MSDITLIPSRFANVTPSDTLAVNTQFGLYVGGAGNVVVTGRDGVDATFACVAGQFLRGKFVLVKATGTTATGLVALYA